MMSAEALYCFKLEAQESKLTDWATSIPQMALHMLGNYNEGFLTCILSLITLQWAILILCFKVGEWVFSGITSE